MRAALLLPMVFVVSAFAGCASESTGSKQALEPDLSGTIRTTYASGNLAAGFGAVEGIVLSDSGAPLAGAYVALLKTSHHATSDKSGKFSFSDVVPGDYKLRADLAKYESLESSVKVALEQVTKIDVVLVSTEGTSIGFRDHVHNLWDDSETERILFDKDVRQQETLLGGGSEIPTCVAAAVLDLGSKAGGCWEIPFALKHGTIVPPGTKEVRMSVTWPKQDAVKTIDLRYAPANESAWRIHGGLTTGQVVVAKVASPMNDHGHAPFTQWKFMLRAKPMAGGAVPISEDHFNEQFIGPYRIKIVAVKGEMFSEPAHKRFWAAGPSLLLTDKEERKIVTAVARSPTLSSCNPTGAATAGSVCYDFGKNKTVPPGTTRLKLTLDVTWGQPGLSALFHQKALAIRTGNVNPSLATWDDFIYPEPTASAGRLTWELKLKPEQTDAFYQVKSNWVLILANKGDERGPEYVPDCPNACGGDIFKLTVEAINDDWTEALAVGQS